MAGSDYPDDLPSRQTPPGPFSIIFLALIDRSWGREAATPFIMVAPELVDLAPWLFLVGALKPNLYSFFTNLHRHNFLASRLARVAHSVAVCFKENFDDEYARDLDGYLAKVLFVAGPLSDATARRISGLRIPPVVLADNEQTGAALAGAGIEAIPLASVTDPESLNRQIARPFFVHPTVLREKGFSPIQLKPALAATEHPGSFTLDPSALNPHEISGEQFLQPIERLSNVLLGRSVSRLGSETPDRNVTLLQAPRVAHIVFGQKVLDNCVATNECNADNPFGRAVATYKESRSQADFEALLGKCVLVAPSIPEACEYGFCVPAINRTIPYARFKREIPTRVFKYFFKQRDHDYVRRVDRRDFKSQADYEQFMALAIAEAGEYSYITALLNLYGQAGRLPILRCPQASSALFSELRHLYDEHAENNIAHFCTRLQQFCQALLDQVSEPYRSFVVGTRTDFIKDLFGSTA